MKLKVCDYKNNNSLKFTLQNKEYYLRFIGFRRLTIAKLTPKILTAQLIENELLHEKKRGNQQNKMELLHKQGL